MAPRPYRGGPVPPPPVLPDDPKAILVVRLSARGDVMFATPIIRALRARYPDAHLTWVVEAPSKDVVQHHPDLDEVVVWDRKHWKGLIKRLRFGELRRAFRELRATLRSRPYDIAIDMQGLSRSGLIAWLSGAPMRIGLGSKEGSSALVHHRYPTGQDIDHMSADPRLLAGWLGLETEPWALDVRLAPELVEGARSRRSDAGVEGAFVLIVPFTTRPQKHWVEERWGPLAKQLHAESGLPVVMVGGPADRSAADRIASAAGDAVVDLVGRTSLGEAMAMISEAELVIGVDTGLTHAGHAFMRPTICMFGPAAYTVAPTPVSRMVRTQLDCQPCMPRGGSPTCGGSYDCMTLISQREVMGHARDLLGLTTVP